MPKTRVLVSCLFVLVLFASAAGAAPRVLERTVHAEALGEDVAVSIYLPAGYDSGTDSYPVLYMVEHDLYFRAVTGAVETYARLDLIPELIVVGVETNDRWRDFTPTRAGIPGREIIANSGGAGRYRDFLADELMPSVVAEFRVEPYAIVCGHSIAGLFAVDALFADRDLFQAGLVTSPSLWWDEETTTARLRSLLAAGPAPEKTLYVGMGDDGPTMIEPAERLRDVLAAGGADLCFAYRFYPEADHQTILVKAFAAGLQFVFADWTPPAELLDGGLPAVLDHYVRLSQRYRFAIDPPEPMLNRLGYRLMGAGDLDGALAAFVKNVELHPDSANVHDSLGEVRFNRGEFVEAGRSYAKSLELDPGNDNAREMLARIEARAR